MNTPIEIKVKNINMTTNLLAQSIDSFTTQLSYPSMALICLLLFLYAKYGLKYLFEFASGTLCKNSSQTQNSAHNGRQEIVVRMEKNNDD